MKLKTKLVGQTITTMPPKDIRRADGTPNELMHDAACAHALMLACNECLRNKEWLLWRAASLMAEWGFDSGEDA